MEKQRYLPSIDLCKGTMPELVIQLLTASGGCVNIPKGMSKDAWPLLEQILPHVTAEQVEPAEGVVLDLIICEGTYKVCLARLIEVKKSKTSVKEFAKWLEDMAEEAAEAAKIQYLEVMVEYGLHMPSVRTRYVKDPETLAFMKASGARVE